jgi:hypothetical protein
MRQESVYDLYPRGDDLPISIGLFRFALALPYAAGPDLRNGVCGAWSL